MAHGGYARRRDAERRPVGRRGRGPGVDAGRSNIKKKQKKQKTVSLKNQIRSTERMLRKTLPPEVRKVQEKKMEDLKNQQELQMQLALQRKIFLRDRKIKFFERRKIERMIRRLERQHRTTSGPNSEAAHSEQLAKLKEDLEYVRFYPKNERYVSLFMGGNKEDLVDKRNKLRKQIKDNMVSAAASGKDLEETGSDDDELLEMSEDDFFASGTSSDEADADDEWTDKSAREPASSTSGRAASGMSGDEKSQRLLSDRTRMPPPRPHKNSFRTSASGRSISITGKRNYSSTTELSTSSNTSNPRSSGPSARNWVSGGRTDLSSNLSSNSDAHKPRRKRRPKKKKQEADS